MRVFWCGMKAGDPVGTTPDVADRLPDNRALVYHDTLKWVWCSAGMVLLLKDYLKNQPTDHYWALAVPSVTGVGWIEYLETVDSPADGSSPYRFESEGELRYYAEKQKLDTKKYQIAEFKPWNWKPQTPGF